MLLIGVLFTVFSPVPAVVFLLMGLGSLFYGVSSKSSAVQGPTVDESKAQQEKSRAELAESAGADAEDLYDELVSMYADKWGGVTEGIQLLDDEINACMRHGDSFAEAVTAVYRRQKKTGVQKGS